MTRFYCICLLFFLAPSASPAQDTLGLYLKAHRYPIDLVESHPDVHTFVMEWGAGMSTLFDQYLASGDSAKYMAGSRPGGYWRRFLQALYAYNQAGGRLDPIRTIGIDFERPAYYFNVLKNLLPAGPVPAELSKEIQLISTTGDSLDCDAFLTIDRVLKDALTRKREAFKTYFGDHFIEVANILSNQGSCKDVLKNRNPDLKRRFELFNALLGDSLYYAELGEAHVCFAKNGLSGLLDRDSKSPFFNRVAVVNVYCYHCHAQGERSEGSSLTAVDHVAIKN
jgi:hypothetical protein